MADMGTMLMEAQDYARQVATRILRQYPDDVDDVLQSAAVKALRGVDNFRGESQFKSWFTRIAINEALMHMRKNRSDDARTSSIEQTTQWTYERQSLDGRPDATRWEPPSEDPSPEQIAIGNELRRAIASVTASWSPVLKGELRLMLLGVGTGVDNTRKARRFRARRILRQALKERGLL